MQSCLAQDGSPRRLRGINRALSASVSAELRLYAQSLLLQGGTGSPRDDTDGKLGRITVRIIEIRVTIGGSYVTI